MKRLLLMIAVLTSAVYVGCKQKDGDRCQINDDCESGVCNKAKGTCASSGQNTMDTDASIPDAIDAPPDARPDAPPDAP